MKLATYKYDKNINIGAVVDDQIVDLSDVAPTMLALIEMGDAGLAAAKTVAAVAATTFSLNDVELLAPIPTPPRNVICLGLNYAEHVEESTRVKGWENTLPDTPVVFTKATTAVTGPYSTIPYNEKVTTELDWEVELGVIIGKPGLNIESAEAMSYVFGYTVLNDISARDLQRKGQQFFKGKSLDGACPMGPWIVTADEISDPHNLAISCRVNGVIKQDSFTKYMIFDIPATLAYLSLGMTLIPGDVIATGTPEGVGFARTPPEFLHPGDVLESEVAQIGILRNTIGG